MELDYDYYIVAFSGGKDSVACVMHLIEQGVPLHKIELHHHCVDGDPEKDENFMDWPCTHSYCKLFADALNLDIYFSWKNGGFEKEMNRKDTPTEAITVVNPDGKREVFAAKGKDNTRMKFPQVSANLSVRWCSAYLKIDVMSRVINNSPRFTGKRSLVITGERAEESTARSKYKTLEPHRCSNKKRHVDQWRPIHAWDEKQVWEIMERFMINPHPAYKVGWGRLSCMKCIFGSPNQWASAKMLDPKGVQKIADYEKQFGLTIHRTRDVNASADKGETYDMPAVPAELAMKTDLGDYPIIVSTWRLPRGAFGESTGPT